MFGRRHNDPLDAHERARTLASDRLLGPLTASDEAWLTEHLVSCEECHSIADAYAADRLLLQSLSAPEPRRDLWARTSAALDRERARASGGARVSANTGLFRWEAFAGLAAVLVVGVLIGQSILSSAGSPTVSTVAPESASAASAAPGATPLEVEPGDVTWVARAADGTYAVNVASVDSVCLPDAAPSPKCAPLDTSATQVQSLANQPSSVLLAPTLFQAAVVEASARDLSGGSILVVPLADHGSLEASPTPSSRASPTPGTGSSPPTSTPSGTPEPSASPNGTSQPSPAEMTPTPSSSVTPGGEPTSTPSPSQSPDSAIAIISNVVVVGDAAYSPDGAWLAFSARAATGQDGPDIYVWHVGDRSAHTLTTDHRSAFASWLGDRILGNRSAQVVFDAATAVPNAFVPVSFTIDPLTGAEHGLPGFHGWRPTVDPSGRWVIYWTGSLAFDAAARTALPDRGWLEIASWSEDAAAAGSLPPGSPARLLPSAGDAVHDWDVRWDPSGKYAGVWIGDGAGNGLGRISLVAIDPATGRIDSARKPVLRDIPALAGFAIGDGRITWATPAGENGEGSRVQVLAWAGPDAGKTTSQPAPLTEDVIIAH